MCWSWIFITVTLLLVQPGQAFHNNQDIRNVIRSQDHASTQGLWLRALQSLGESANKGVDTGTIVIIVLFLFLLLLSAAGAYIWHTRRKHDSRGKDSSENARGKLLNWWANIRNPPEPTDIEKGGDRYDFQGRYAQHRQGPARLKEKMEPPPPFVVVKKPSPPVLPHIPRYPSILEHLSASRPNLSNTHRTKNPQAKPRVLLPPPTTMKAGLISGALGTAERQGRTLTRSPSELMKSWFNRRSQNPFVPPHEGDLHAAVQRNNPSAIPRTPSRPSSPSSSTLHLSPVPISDSQPLRPNKLMKSKTARAERVRQLHMDLNQHGRDISGEVTPLRVVHLSEEGAARLRAKTKTPRTAKGLRFLLPLSPKDPTPAAPLYSAVAVGLACRGANNARGDSRTLHAVQQECSSDQRPLRTAYI
ncbi:hypothetical protein AX17_001157 [Amanita inopinata Kibby_2008]|nr:hypothetical protein AX17_001157 [Amanita inopinata Kibby_2008]